MNLFNRNIKSFVFFIFLISSSIFLHSQPVVNVSSISGLQKAINNASEGNTIILADGTYSNSTLIIGTNGITVKSETPGGVILNGTQKVDISGNNITFSGFQFLSGDNGKGGIITVSGNHNLLINLNINGFVAGRYITIKKEAQFNEILYCNIENKPIDNVGSAVQISASPDVIGYNKIRFCSFRNFPGKGKDFGNEPIRIGVSTEKFNISRTIIEHCYFEDVGLGDSETISVKACENVLRYNTFSNNPKGALVLRSGNKNVVYGNFFINGSGGVRIKEGSGHAVYNNYFETGTVTALKLQLEKNFELKDIIIAHNTFVNMGALDLGGEDFTNIVLANNIFKKSSNNSIFRDTKTNAVFIGNIYDGNLGITISSGMKKADPKLETNNEGYYSLSSKSPAIDAADPNYPAILDIPEVDDDPFLMLDISGQARPEDKSKKDVGCDEYTTGTIKNRVLQLKNVGPEYLRKAK